MVFIVAYQPLKGRRKFMRDIKDMRRLAKFPTKDAAYKASRFLPRVEILDISKNTDCLLINPANGD